ncbi:MAG: DNA gyrase inhibitor YacG [Gammaproteobacteria bacterium]|nr:DNA gyrase inhibitor YacG [Gammaproteobacteria bacterium]
MKTISVKCPTCKKTVIWEKENLSKPFCSERCKGIDLGDWASGKHSIAGESVEIIPDHEDFN